MTVPRNHGGFGQLVFLLAGLIVLVLSVATHRFFPRFVIAMETHRQEHLERFLDLAVTHTQPTGFLYLGTNAIIQSLRSRGIGSPEFQTALDTARQRWGIDFDLHVYQDFTPVFSTASNSQQAFFAEILRGISLSGEPFKKAQIDLRSDIECVFGPGKRLDLLKRHSLGWGALATGSRDLYLYGNFPDGQSLFLLVKRIPGDNERFLQIPSDMRRNLGFASSEKALWIPPEGTTAEQVQVAWSDFRASEKPFVHSGSFDWVFCRSLDGRMWCAISRSEGKTIEHWLYHGILSGYALAGCLFMLFVMILAETKVGARISQPFQALSIRSQFLGLFLMSAMVPLGISFLLGSISYLDQQDIRRNETTYGAEKRLLSLERCYHEVMAEFDRFCVDFTPTAMVTGFQQASLSRTISEFVDQDRLQHFELRDGSGDILFSTWDPRIHGSPWATEIFAKMAIRRHAANRVGESLKKVSGQDIMAESLMASADPAMTIPLRFPGKVWNMGMGGGSPAISYWNVYNDLATGPAFVFMVHQLGWQFKRKVQEIVLQSQSEESGFLALLKVGCNGKTMAGFFPELTGPEAESLLKTAIRVSETGESLTRQVRLDKGMYWATIKLNSFLSQMVFLDVRSQDSQVRALSFIRWRMLLALGLAVLLTLVGTKLLGDLFLVPIADLQDGIRAIARRDVAYRLVERRPDEFGIVVSAFNQFLIGLGESLSGRRVQESLLPSTSSAPEGYEIEFFRTPATELAGDYHDVFGLPDGRWVIVIGDVTGHGISAALPMAMAKATITYQQFTGWEFPSQVFEHMNALFFSQLKPSRKYMTFQCLVLDPRTHQVTMESAAHGFPLVIRGKTGVCEEISMPAFPMGMKGTWKSAIETLDLLPGDTIALYTDGYTECANPAGVFFEVSGLVGQLEELIRQKLPLPDILKELIRKLDEFKGPGPYADD